MAKSERVDALLVARGLCESREQAKRLIMAGEVMCGTERVAKPSVKVAQDEGRVLVPVAAKEVVIGD